MNQILLGVAMFTAVILLLVAILLAAKRKLVAHGDVSILINDDPDKIAARARRQHAARHAGRAQDLHPLGLRRQGRLRRLRGDRQGRRRRPAADRDRLHQPRRGEARLPARLPGQGQARHEDRDRAGGLQRPQVAVQGAVEPQRRHVHQGAEARAARRRGGAVPRRRLRADRVPAAHACRSATSTSTRGSARPGTASTSGASRRRSTEPVQRAYSMANYPNEKGILLFTIRIAFPPGYRDRHPAGDHELVDLRPEAGRRGHRIRAVRRVLRARHRQGDVLHRRRRRHGADALAHLRPVQAPAHPAQGDVLVRRAQPRRGVLRRRVRGAAEARTRTSSGTSRCPSRCPRTTGRGRPASSTTCCTTGT